MENSNHNVHDLAKKIASLIGYDYKPEQNGLRSGELHWNARIQGANGALWLGGVGYGSSKGRVEVSVAWPLRSNGGSYTLSSYQHDNKKTSITVSGSKTPEQMASDIQKRLLPDAEFLYKKAATALAQENDWLTQKQAAILKVAALCKADIPKSSYPGDRDGLFYFNRDMNIRLRVSSATSIKVEIDANVDNIDKVAEFLATIAKK